jgi:hypothetical protein
VTSHIAGYATLTLTVVLNLAWLDTLFGFAQPRPGNPDSELLPVGGLVLALATLAVLVAIATRYEPGSLSVRPGDQIRSLEPKERVRA